MTTDELLRKRMAELQAEKAALKAKSATLKFERERFIVQANEANAKARDLTVKIEAIERPRMIEILQEISSVAAGLNGLRMNK